MPSTIPYNFKFPVKKRRRYLRELRKGYTLGGAAARVGVSRKVVLRYRNTYPSYEKMVQDAYEQGTDYLEDVARKRAVKGRSDRLLLALLKARNKPRFSDRSEVTGVDGGPVQHSLTVTFVGRSKVT